MLKIAIVLGAAVLSSHALAADADRGRQLAQSHCASCHNIAPPGGAEVAASPPFDAIGRKYGFDAVALVGAILGPHPRMNFSPSPVEAQDIAAYISAMQRPK